MTTQSERRCWRCNGSGKMDLDRGQYAEYATCCYCKGTGDFQERRGRSRRSTDRGLIDLRNHVCAEEHDEPRAATTMLHEEDDPLVWVPVCDECAEHAV